ncbi:MAG: ATP-binding cassette domain-containing protein [Geodermatophilaceae bacterium]
MAVTLRAKGLSASYGQRTLISGLDLVVVPGDVFGLVGANGSGKTTLLTLLAATGQPTSDDTGDVTSPTNPARTVMSPPRGAFAQPAGRDDRVPPSRVRPNAQRDDPRLAGPPDRDRRGRMSDERGSGSARRPGE